VPVGVVAAVNIAAGNLATVSNAVSQQPSWLVVGNGAAGTMNLLPGGSLRVAGEMDVGNGDGATGVFNMSGGSLTVNGWLEAGRLGGTTANGTWNLTGGTLTQNGNGGNFDIGEGTGVFNLSNATVNITAGELWVGQGGNGTLTLAKGGAINCHDWVVVGRAGGTGVLNMSGGTFTHDGANHFVIANGTGTVNQSGGIFSLVTGDLRITESGTGLYNLTGGTANVNTILVGSQGSGSAELRIGGSGVMSAGAVVMGNAGSMTSVVNLNGGILQATAITFGSSAGTATFNFNGGTLRAGGAGAIMSGLTAGNIRNGGAVIDDGGYAIAMAQPLVHSSVGGDNAIDGGLTKLGSGTLKLASSSTYTGDTVVKAGTLRLDIASASTGALRLINGAHLNLNFSGNYVVGSFYTNGVALSAGTYNAGNLPVYVTGSGSVQVRTAPVSYSYVNLISNLTCLERLAQLPLVGETSAEWSSRDRASTYNSSTGQYLNWGANNDGTGCISNQPDGGVVMAQMAGPGCIWRIWSASPGSGHLKIYLDGSVTPAVDMAFQDYFNLTQPPFTYPSLSYTVCRGFDSYLPIPYNASCKVVAYGSWGEYFHFNYSTFPPGVTVPTFTTNLTATEQGALSNVDNFFVNNLGSDPAGARSGQTSTTNSYAIAPGKSLTALNFIGQGAITAFQVRVNGMTNPSDQWVALRALTVSMAWDGETNASVWAPLGDFFGTGCGYIPYTSLPLGIQSNGWMYCYWYMPFASQAQIVIGNDDSVTRNVEVAITRAPLTTPIGSLARFHAKWNRGVYVTNDGRSPDYRFLTNSGQGRFVGLALHVYQTVDVTPGPWWGEGDEKFLVDGERFPSWFGTGSEDYFGWGWGTPGYFTKPYHTQSLSPTGTLFAPGNRAMNRFHITDNIPFQSSLDACIEKWFYTDETITRYGAMPYWYLASGGSDPYGALPLSARTNYYLAPTPVYSAIWTNPAGGLWSNAANWTNKTIADSSGATADFSTLNLAADALVHLDFSRTVGSLIFGDKDSDTGAGWILDNNGGGTNTLTLSGSAPTITVNAMGTGAAAVINADITAVGGFTKLGDGPLILGGSNSIAGLIVDGGTNIITGNTTISGTGSSCFYLGNANAAYNGTVVLQNGAALSVNGNFGDNFVIGRDGGSGTVIQNGGTFSYHPLNQPDLFVGAANNTNTRSEYDINGGRLDLNLETLVVGYGAGVVITGLVNQVGGVITNVGLLALPGLGGNGCGIYSLHGGSIYIGEGGISSANGNYVINLGGGRVGAEANWASSLNMNLTDEHGPVTFDTETGNTITLSGALTGNGGLTVAGSGIVNLSGANSYKGDTTVNAGTLELAQPRLSANATVAVVSGARLQLDFVGTNNVGELVLNGAPQPAGIYNYSTTPAYFAAGTVGSLQVVLAVSIAPTNISCSVSGGRLTLSWPVSYQEWILQAQTNALGTGLGSNWVDIGALPGTTTNIPLNEAPAVFYRLRHP
jgi:autotransporter-associated beta strand protein